VRCQGVFRRPMDCKANWTLSLRNRPVGLTGPTACPAASAVPRTACQTNPDYSSSPVSPSLRRAVPIKTYRYPPRMASYRHGHAGAQFSQPISRK
jgi:hypothetical protein